MFFFLLILPLVVVLVYGFGERAEAGGYASAFTFDNYLNLGARGKAFFNTLVRGGKVFFIGNALVDLFLQSRNWPFGAAVAMALVMIMFVTVFVYMRFVLRKSGVRNVAMV
jgi:ABC-type spermidine/putrescine transport system permease subunit I